jgi:hypothetical protein
MTARWMASRDESTIEENDRRRGENEERSEVCLGKAEVPDDYELCTLLLATLP